ncbi:hypothetical protein Bpfe_001243, partial [Biomphalaria pfeifferi]
MIIRFQARQDKMHFMLQLLIATAVMSLALCKSEEVKAILYEYNDTPILRLKQQFILRGHVMVQTESHNDLYNYLKIEYRKKDDTDFHMFDTLNFKQCMASERFYCVQDKNKFLTYLNTTTAVEFNQSEWKMIGSYNGYEFSSNALILPIVQPNVETSLFINLNQSYSKCEQAILENEEIVLEGHVRFYGDFEEDEMYITIEKKLTNSTNFNIYKTVSLNHCETSSDFKCTRDGDLYSFTTTLYFNATKELSESLWRLAGKFKGTPYYSTPVQLPRILDSSKVLMRLNGQTLPKSNTSITLQEDEELTLCCDIAPSPCLAVITVNHNQSFTNQSCVSHRPIKGDKSTYRFGYIVCGDDKYSQVFTIDVNILQVKDSTYEERVGIILGAVFGAIVFIVLCSLIYCWRKSKNKKSVQKFSGQRPRSSPPQAKSLSPENSSDCLLDMPEERKERNSIVLEAEVIKEPHSSRQNTQNKETKGIKESTKK